jgi:hypothetical protein
MLLDQDCSAIVCCQHLTRLRKNRADTTCTPGCLILLSQPLLDHRAAAAAGSPACHVSHNNQEQNSTQKLACMLMNFCVPDECSIILLVVQPSQALLCWTYLVLVCQTVLSLQQIASGLTKQPHRTCL